MHKELTSCRTLFVSYFGPLDSLSPRFQIFVRPNFVLQGSGLMLAILWWTKFCGRCSLARPGSQGESFASVPVMLQSRWRGREKRFSKGGSCLSLGWVIRDISVRQCVVAASQHVSVVRCLGLVILTGPSKTSNYVITPILPGDTKRSLVRPTILTMMFFHHVTCNLPLCSTNGSARHSIEVKTLSTWTCCVACQQYWFVVCRHDTKVATEDPIEEFEDAHYCIIIGSYCIECGLCIFYTQHVVFLLWVRVARLNDAG